MSELTEESEIEFIKEFLKQRGYFSTFDCFVKEVNYKYVLKENSTFASDEERSKFARFIQLTRSKNLRLERMIEQFNLLFRKYKSIIQIARHCFGIVIELIEKITQSGEETLKKEAEKYKEQLGRYHKIIVADEWTEKTVIINDAILEEHKKQLNKSLIEEKVDDTVQVLLSLRMNALHTAPDFRKKWIRAFISKDVFQITSTDQDKLVLNLLSHDNANIRQATVALLSVVASSYEGVEYLSTNGIGIPEKVYDLLQRTENGQVLQRFIFAFLQKISYNPKMVDEFVYLGVVDYLGKWIIKGVSEKTNAFAIEYACALLANILRNKTCFNFLMDNDSVYKSLVEAVLNSIKVCESESILKHLLTCVSLLNKSRFPIRSECEINDKIVSFKNEFQLKKMETESKKVDQKIILGLCDYIVSHSDDNDESQINEIMESFKKNESQVINLECFQDEINYV